MIKYKLMIGIGAKMKKISSKISLTIMCCSCIAVLLVGNISLFQGTSMVSKEATEKLVWMARYYSTQFSMELNRIEEEVQEMELYIKDTIDTKALKSNPDYLKEYEDLLAHYLFDFAKDHTDSTAAWCYFNPELSDTPHDVYFVDGDDDQIPDRQEHIDFSYFNTPPSLEDDKYWWFGPIESKKGIWTNPYEWPLSSGQVIKVVSYALPIYIDNELIAVIGSYYHFDKMREEILDLKVYDNGFATLYNEKLDVIIHPDYFAGNRNNSDNLTEVDNKKFANISKKIMKNEYGIIPYEEDGKKSLFAYSKLSNDWIMGINPPMDEMYSGLYLLITKLLIAVAACILLSIGAAFIMGRFISKPILKVVDAAQKIGMGDLTIQVEVPTKDEIKYVADSLNSMVKNTKSLQDELEQLAYYDSLTGIANKFLFEKTVKKLVSQHSLDLAYVILDINKFKIINDLFGLEYGDLFLKHISQVLITECCDPEICSRFNADNFHFILKYTNRFSFESRLQRIASNISQYFIDLNKDYKLSMGFGVYVINDTTVSVNSMGDKAKLALSEIKGIHGNNLYFYNSDIRNKIIEEQEIENTMESALKNNEFKLYLQPKYGVHDHKIKGAEALTRWQHPTKGLIPPDNFIPFFERNGFIADLDLYMLENICKVIKYLQESDMSVIPISINQSRQYLHHGDYIFNLTNVLEKYNVDHSLVELEITETAFFEDQDAMIPIIKILHDLDFKISMDDFGSGYSSLNMLQNILVDVLKIDKNFFKESINSQRGKKIVENIISMASDLNIEVVAEGIETSEQLGFLEGTNCELIQGYYFSKPVTVEEFYLLLKDK